MPKKTSKKSTAPKAKKRAEAARSKPATTKRPVARKPKAKPAAVGGTRNAEDPRHLFVNLVMKLGTEEAQHLLDRVVDVQTPTTR